MLLQLQLVVVTIKISKGTVWPSKWDFNVIILAVYHPNLLETHCDL